MKANKYFTSHVIFDNSFINICGFLSTNIFKVANQRLITFLIFQGLSFIYFQSPVNNKALIIRCTFNFISIFSINLQTSIDLCRSPASLLHNILICVYYLKNTTTRNHLLKQVRNKSEWKRDMSHASPLHPTHQFPGLRTFKHQEFSELTKNFTKCL